MEIFFFLVDVEEWDEDRYDEVNLRDIPEDLWKLIPSYGKYIENIMKFAGYVNRESILRLKCDKEVSLMKYVADRSKLVKDKEAMFGIFELDPSLLAISPGLKPTFKRFISKVENLVPNRSKERPAKRPASCDRRPSLEAKRKSTGASKLLSDDDMMTVADLEKRFLKWLSHEVEKKGKNVSKEDQEKSFQLKATEGNDFQFICLQINCFEACTLKYCKTSNSVNMSSAYRHITNTCWLSPKRSPSFKRPKTGNFFGTPKLAPKNKASVKDQEDFNIESPMKNPVHPCVQCSHRW